MLLLFDPLKEHHTTTLASFKIYHITRKQNKNFNQAIYTSAL